jgi:hypothetical protein
MAYFLQLKSHFKIVQLFEKACRCTPKAFSNHKFLKYDLKGQIRGFQIGPMSLENIPVVQAKGFWFQWYMFNYEVIQVCILTRI